MIRAFLPKALALTVLTAGLTLAGAQQPQTEQTPAPDNGAPAYHHHAPNPQHQAAMLSRKLNLTPDQTAKIEPILADRAARMQALEGNQQLAPQDRHQQMRAIHESTEQQLSAILTPDQMAQMKAMRHNGHGHHGPDGETGDTAQQPS